MKTKQIFDAIFQSIFWLWNLTFLSIVYLGILPVIAGSLIMATIDGIIPLEFALTMAATIAVPTVCTFIGARLIKQPLQLMRLFYGVEAPLFLLCLIRLFLLRELTPASSLIIATIVLCIAAFLVEILYGYLGKRETIQNISDSENSDRKQSRFLRLIGNKRSAWLQLACHSLMLLVGIWAATLLMYYAVPVGLVTVAGFFTFVIEFFQFEWVSSFLDTFKYGGWAWALIWIPLSFILFGLSCSLFVVMPSLYGFLYIHSGRKIWQSFAAQYGKNQALIGSLGVVAAWLAVFAALQQQPQVAALKMLATPPANDSSRQTLLAKSDTIRSGLVNAYLSPYRYLSTVGENNHIYEMYKSFSLPDSAARSLQNSYNVLMSPFLYQGSSADVKKAEKLYGEFFDTEIQKGDRAAVQHAVQSTSNREEAKAGLLNVNQEKVWLKSQSVTVKENGDWADVQLYEVYNNQTTNLQEVFYYFSLPESAAVTGIWLGDTADLNKRFVFTVSPRGAAQQVYNQQVVERVDPALLEQIGPKQYRLRAFPIPAKLEFRQTDNAPTEMHLWLTYKVMRQPQGWAMPVLAEKRNIFWNQNTRRIIAGKEVKYSGKQARETWLPQFLPAAAQQPLTAQRAILPGENIISAQPLAAANYSLPQGKKIAVILDTSRSMAAQTQQVKQTFEWLKTHTAGKNAVDLYVASAAGMPPKLVEDVRKFDAGKVTFYGTIQLKDMLEQFAQLRGDKNYDTVFVVSDRHSYELSDDRKTKFAISAPLWVVSLGGLPPGYDDATLKVIQDSGGGVSTDIQEAMQRVATTAASGPSTVSVVDGYTWSYAKNAKSDKKLKSATVIEPTDTGNEGFKPIAARQLIAALSKQKSANQLTQLDAMHGLAKNFKVVTPYSSMIVLVNDAQRQQLKAAEAKSDRFDREVESGKEELTKPNNPLNVSGVPEPEEWLLLAVGAIGLVVIFLRQRRAKMA